MLVSRAVCQHFCVAREIIFATGNCRGFAVEAFVAACPVFLEPVKNHRHFQLAVAVAVTRTVREKTYRLLFELLIKAVSYKRLFTQRRAAYRGAVSRVMHAHFVVNTGFPQHFMLDFVEEGILTKELEKFTFPAIIEHAANILDRLHRIVLQNQRERLAVVNVDKEGHLLRLAPGIKVSFLHACE